ncbi:MAG: FIST C-terminal domain-containing protein [Planctomycetes bacterium]|nr:FIST C-terminal domain-containing protein [Planctomycetota bacterium]
MRFESALSTAPDLDEAVADVTASLRGRLGSTPIDLVIAFAGMASGGLDELPGRLRLALGARRLVGCTGGGLVGGGREHESTTGLAVAALSLPDVRLEVAHVRDEHLPDADAPPAAWRSVGKLDPSALRGLCLLADPFSADSDRLLRGLDYAYPHTPKFGGLASGGRAPGHHRMFVDDVAHDRGAALLAVGPGVRVATAVSQGCAPLGEVGRITQCQGSYLQQIDGRPALRFVQDQLAALDGPAREVAERSPLFLGMEMDPFQLAQPGAGEFVIRNLLGFDRGSGTIGVAGDLAVGRRVRLHLRDRVTSAGDLRRQLATIPREPAPFGALLFSCLGRGEHLYGEPDHDSRTFRQCVGPAPLAGFFCNGEIGPVGGTTHVHGYTSVFGVLIAEGTR